MSTSKDEILSFICVYKVEDNLGLKSMVNFFTQCKSWPVICIIQLKHSVV